MTTTTTSYGRTVEPRSASLRQMLTGAAAFDATGGVFCLAAASHLARWLSIPQSSAYVTGAVFLAAAAAGAFALRSQPVKAGLIVGANEAFAAWCVLMLAFDKPNTLGVALLVVAVLSSAGTGFAELRLARR